MRVFWELDLVEYWGSGVSRYYEKLEQGMSSFYRIFGGCYFLIHRELHRKLL